MKKNNFIEIIIITIVTIILCSNFLQMHFSSDTYVLYNLGYFNYPSEYFLPDGRLISALACYIAGIFNLPIPVYIIGMDFIGMILLSLAIYIMSKVLRKIIKPKDKFTEILLIIASNILILNQYALEYLLFPESAVMCLGVLFLVIAIKVLVESPKHKYLKIFICLLITGLSYQAELNIFPVLAIMIYIVKQIKEKKKITIFLKEFIIEMLKLSLIIMAVLAITLGIIYLTKSVLNNNTEKIISLTSYRAFIRRGRIVSKYMDELWNNCMHMLPKHTFTATIVLTIILLVLTKAKKQTIIYYILLMMVILLVCTAPLFVFDMGIHGRVSVPLAMVMGISCIILIANVQEIQTKWIKNVAVVFTIFLFVVNAIFILQNIAEHIAANRVDEDNGKTIKYLIEKYEEENNIKVTKFSYTYDIIPQQFAVGIKPMQSMTERKFAWPWCVLYAMDYYCERNFELVDGNPFVFDSKNKYVNYDQFVDEQIIFEYDTVYMIIY